MSYSKPSSSSMTKVSVKYTGWCPIDGLYGDKFVQPIFHHIIQTRQQQIDFEPEHLQVKVSREHIQILKEVKLTPKSLPVFKDYPNIPIPDITYCTRMQHDNKSYLCLIVISYDCYTGNPVHLYVYELKNEEEAEYLYYLINKRINKDNIKKRAIEIENMLLEENKIIKSELYNYKEQMRSFPVNFYRSGSTGSSLNSSLNSSNGHKRSDQSNFMNKNGYNFIGDDAKQNPTATPKHLVNELSNKLHSNQILLLPPRDYDTIHRKQGNPKIDVFHFPDSHLPFSKM